MYEKPEVFVVMTDEEDIIRTSTLIDIGAGGGTGGDDEDDDDVIDWNF